MDLETRSRFLLKLGIGAVAILAVLGRGFVEQDPLAIKIAEQLVTIAATHVLVRARQSERRALVVVEQRWFPLGAVMTVGAGRDPVFLGELTAVDVGVALFALGGCLGEVHIDERGFQVGRLMAVAASNGPVRADQGELGLAVIEASEVFPGLGGVASLTAGRGAVRAESLHALGKLIVVRILVAGGAGKLLEVIDGCCLGRVGAFGRCGLHGSGSLQ